MKQMTCATSSVGMVGGFYKFLVPDGDGAGDNAPAPVATWQELYDTRAHSTGRMSEGALLPERGSRITVCYRYEEI